MNELEQAELAAAIRESVMSVAECGWKACDAGLCLEHSVELVITSAEELVQALVRRVDR